MAPTSKKRYYVIFIDDYSRKYWISFMQKDQTFTKFCEFKALVKNDSDLNRNAKNYIYNHKHKVAVRIILHFINVKY